MYSTHKGYNEIVSTCTLLEYAENKACNSSLWIETWMDEINSVIYRALFPEGYTNLPITITKQHVS